MDTLLRVRKLKGRCPRTEKGKRPNYAKEFEQDAVKLVLEHDCSCQEASRRLGIAYAKVPKESVFAGPQNAVLET
jgi:transposase-like protein